MRSLSHKLKMEYLPILIERDGGFCCWFCKKELTLKTYIFEHLNGNRLDNRIENIVLACQSCNIKKKFHSDLQILAKEKLQDNENKNFLREKKYVETQDRDTSSAEIQINVSNFDITKQFLTETILIDSSIEFSEALNCCTFLCKDRTGHGSQQSVRNYIATLTSSVGPFMIIKDENKKKIIVKRKGN